MDCVAPTYLYFLSGQQADFEKAELSKQSGKSYQECKKHASVALDKLGLPAGYNGWTSRKGFQGVGLPSGGPNGRIKALLNVGWGKRMQMMPGVSAEIAAKGWYADVSQSVERMPFGRLGTLTTSSAKYSYEADCILSGAHHLISLGFPHHCATKASGLFSEHELRNLIGEGFALPCVATVVFLFFCNPYGPWWRPESNIDESTR